MLDREKDMAFIVYRAARQNQPAEISLLPIAILMLAGWGFVDLVATLLRIILR